jgi:(heptosyl)LPS beta-1,4-glucosyltransferase
MISVVINTFNEEKNLPRVLASVKDFADEIIVVDMESSDKTTSIAADFGAKVYQHKKTGYVEPARNFAISKAKGDWILIIDADEELPKSLASKLHGLIIEDRGDYYRVPRKNVIFGKWIKNSRWWPDYNIRFFKKEAVIWSEVIHSVPETRGTGCDIEAKEEFALNHYHYESIEQYLERMNRYSGVYARNLIKTGYKFEWSDLIVRPSNEFLSRFFSGGGYKDGLHGLALSGLQAFSELVLYLKVWQSEKFPQRNLNPEQIKKIMKNSEKDFLYWQADMMVKEKGGFIPRIRRKLKI